MRTPGRLAKQTAVYWGTPTPDGTGGYTYDDPVEIRVRWEERQELFIDAAGREVRSSAVVRPLQDLDMNGYLYLGDLDDLSSADEGDPQGLAGARPIRGWAKSPTARGGAYVRKAWL